MRGSITFSPLAPLDAISVPTLSVLMLTLLMLGLSLIAWRVLRAANGPGRLSSFLLVTLSAGVLVALLGGPASRATGVLSTIGDPAGESFDLVEGSNRFENQSGVAQQVSALTLDQGCTSGGGSPECQFGRQLPDGGGSCTIDVVCNPGPGPGDAAPQLLPIGDRTIPAGSAFTTRLFGLDPDAGDTLTYSLDEAPAGMGVDPISGDLSWTPPVAGTETVTARVTDSTARFDTQEFTITATELLGSGPTNRPPSLAPIDDQTLTLRDDLAITAQGSDPDGGDLSYSLPAAPSGMSIDASSGAITWNATPAGVYDVTVVVTDPGGLSAAQSFSVNVNAVNEPPEARDDIYIARKGETLVIPAPEGVLVNDTDANGDPLSATRITDPSLGTLDSFNPDGSFSYTPSEPSGITIGLQLKCETNLSDFATAAGTASAADVDQDGDVEIVGMNHIGLSAGVQ